MARKARIVVPDTPHHIVQRGNRKEKIFFTGEDKDKYLCSLTKYSERYKVGVLSYCLMDNHIHLILEPSDKKGLSSVMNRVNTGHSKAINIKNNWSGHLWHSRYYSCAMSRKYFWTALKYVENNPVAANMVVNARDYYWSSAYSRCRKQSNRYLLYDDLWKKEFSEIEDWDAFLSTAVREEDLQKIKDATRRDFPVGKDLVSRLEKELGRRLVVRKVGRPIK